MIELRLVYAEDFIITDRRSLTCYLVDDIFALYLDSFWLLCYRWQEIVKLHGFLQLGCQDVAMLSFYMLCKHTHRSHYWLSENHHGFNFTWQWNLQDKNSGLTVQLSNHTRINWMSPLVCLGQWFLLIKIQVQETLPVSTMWSNFKNRLKEDRKCLWRR